MGFQDRPALDAAARYGPDDGAAPADEPGLMPSAETAESKQQTARATAPFSF
jgi:hypothetical protein